MSGIFERATWHIRNNTPSRNFLRAIRITLFSFAVWKTLPLPASSHQAQQVQERLAYHYRITLGNICKILLTSRAKPGRNFIYSIFLINSTNSCIYRLLKLTVFYSVTRTFYSASSSPLLLRSAPETAWILCRNFISKRHRQLRVKDSPKVPTWRLERESNSTLRMKGVDSTNELHMPHNFPIISIIYQLFFLLL